VIDIHSHILPGLDDGSKSLEESIAMVRMAAAAGTTDIVATPHANQEYRFDPKVVQDKISEVQAAACDSPRIHYGCDFHLTMENIEDALRAPEKYSIDHHGYLLVEFSDFHIPKTADEIFARMMRAGMLPIVTHPERNQLLQKRLAELQAWASQGVLMQVTANSFLGRFGRTAKRFAEELMANGLVHFIASDAHDTKWRTTDMRESRRYVEKQYGVAAAERIFEENPQAVLKGVAISPIPLVVRKRRWFW
jgi:protein-tyrosine phosphatase